MVLNDDYIDIMVHLVTVISSITVFQGLAPDLCDRKLYKCAFSIFFSL